MQSMEEMYQQYSNTVYKYLLCLCQNAEIAEDEKAQSIFL